MVRVTKVVMEVAKFNKEVTKVDEVVAKVTMEVTITNQG